MRKIVTGLLVSAFLSGASAFADDTNNYGINPGPNDTFTPSENVDNQPGVAGTDSSTTPAPNVGDKTDEWHGGNQQPGIQQPGTADSRYADTGMTSEASSREIQRGYLDNTLVGIQPQVGVIGLTDAAGNSTTRAALGLTADWNIASTVNRDAGAFFVGPATGLIYSHVGAPSSNFFGTNSDVGGFNSNANLLLIPADLKLGYAVTPNLRLSLRGGGNVTYRSVANSLNLGASSVDLGANSGWRIFPNVGGDVEIGFGPNVSLMLRPDVTLTPGDDLYTGTVGLNIGLG